MTNKAMMQKELAQVSFSMDELRLFLDTHPHETEALAAYRMLRKKRDEIIERYEELCGPVNAYSAGGEKEWNWLKQPWPWEMEA